MIFIVLWLLFRLRITNIAITNDAYCLLSITIAYCLFPKVYRIPKIYRHTLDIVLVTNEVYVRVQDNIQLLFLMPLRFASICFLFHKWAYALSIQQIICVYQTKDKTCLQKVRRSSKQKTQLRQVSSATNSLHRRPSPSPTVTCMQYRIYAPQSN